MKNKKTPNPSTTSGGKRGFSTYARRQLAPETESHVQPHTDYAFDAAGNLDAAAFGLERFDPRAPAQPAAQGLKFDAPTMPMPRQAHLKHRYDPVVEQVTKLIMRDGKLSVAQRVRPAPASSNPIPASVPLPKSPAGTPKR